MIAPSIRVLLLWLSERIQERCITNAMNEQILVNKSDSIATITFNRPDQRNAISYEMWRSLGQIMESLEGDDAIRCVVFRGAGGQAFSAGADIKDFDEHRYDSASAANYAKAFESALERIEHMRCPTVSAIQGFCVGGGLELAAATDIRIATKGSRFGVPVNRLGLTAGWDELRRMIAVAGIPAVKYLVLSGRIIDIDEAMRFGLVTAVVEDTEFDIAVEKLSSQIANGAPLSARDHKLMIRQLSIDPDTAKLSEDEFNLQFRVFDSADFQEGVKAFKAKRRPVFKAE